MTPLIRARHHAQVVEDLESCAPDEVDNSYLGRALQRMRLPISVVPSWRGNYLILHAPGLADCGSSFKDTAEATRAYFDLVETLTDPAAHAPLARTAASLSAAANSPVTPGVSSSSTAAPPPPAVDAPVPPRGASAAGETPSSAATPSGVR